MIGDEVADSGDVCWVALSPKEHLSNCYYWYSALEYCDDCWILLQITANCHYCCCSLSYDYYLRVYADPLLRLLKTRIPQLLHGRQHCWAMKWMCCRTVQLLASLGLWACPHPSQWTSHSPLPLRREQERFTGGHQQKRKLSFKRIILFSFSAFLLHLLLGAI